MGKVRKFATKSRADDDPPRVRKRLATKSARKSAPTDADIRWNKRRLERLRKRRVKQARKAARKARRRRVKQALKAARKASKINEIVRCRQWRVALNKRFAKVIKTTGVQQCVDVKFSY